LQGACNDSIDGRYGVFTAVIEAVATAGAFEAVKDRGQLAVGVTNVTDFLRLSVRAVLRGPPVSCLFDSGAGRQLTPDR